MAALESKVTQLEETSNQQRLLVEQKSNEVMAVQS